ncbi:MAG TPA: metal ABC transporter permease [Franconibacter helveticus]|uniref:metal ABC transporter permease n=1 Tax=Franconibacter helveticus TaxID=357240 RepID=UPI000426ED08|nr:metal ABC transporter permease [Franconibacter helveticus]MDU6924538.1 metal ABC transporter permease [Franconibacter helveticus]HAZ53934.1 metal ABC transporter permease [Franconibacter helveticus]
MTHPLFDAFITFGFMRRSLVACLALSLSITPLGVFLLLRRMSLTGDALSHAVLPGVATGYLLCGMSLLAMGAGGFIVGLLVALLSGWVSKATSLPEDSSFAGFYLGSLALGVTLVSLRGSGVDLLHLLFGSLLAVDNASLIFIGVIASATLFILALSYRALVMEAFDAAFLQVRSRRLPSAIHALFLALLVMNLVAGFQILGTLMTVGLMMLPAIAARCWANRLPWMLALAAITGMLSALLGLTWSWYQSLPAGPAIVLTATLFFFFSVLFGTEKGIFPLVKLKQSIR